MSSIPDDDTGAAIKRWEVEGSDLTKPMTIDFFVAVSSKDVGTNFSQQNELRDFKTDVEYDNESGTWTCYCSKTMIPDYKEIVEIERMLSSVASRVGGCFLDGFASYGNKSKLNSKIH